MSYVDFNITEQGDLTLKEQNVISTFALNFYASKYPVAKIKFFQEEINKTNTDNALKIKFMTQRMSENTTYNSEILVDKEEFIQNIKIALRTELGELPLRKDFGSKLVLYKHKPLLDKENLNNIQNTVKEVASRVLPNVLVIANPENLDNSFFYCQNVTVYIYSNELLFCKFDI